MSVGTLYQYYPNKQSLLFGLLENHMIGVAEAVESACTDVRGKPLHEMLEHVVDRYVKAKMRRIDVSEALYQISADIDGPAIVKRSVQRSKKALVALIGTAPDLKIPPDAYAVDVMFAAMGGVTAAALSSGASDAMVPNLREHLVLLCQTYMTAVTKGANSWSTMRGDLEVKATPPREY